jgi:hypothetical protein
MTAPAISWADESPDFDDHDCANCGGEGFTLGCSWDWQCDTYDAGEGTCLCERPCDWCQPYQKEQFPSVALAESLAKERRNR